MRTFPPPKSADFYEDDIKGQFHRCEKFVALKG